MVSRRKTTTPNEQPQQPVEAVAVPAEGTNPAAVTVNVEVNEPPAKPARKRPPSRRTSNRPAEADSPGEVAAPSGQQGNGHAEGDQAALLRALQELSHGHLTHSAEMAREFQEIKALVQSLRQAAEGNEGRLQALRQDSQETQTQLIQHTAQLNDLVHLSEAAGQDEEDVWDRLAVLSEEFRQASDRLLERMAEQTLRLEVKVDQMTARLASLQRQLEATSDAASEAALQLEESRLRTQDAQNESSGLTDTGTNAPAEGETAAPETAPPSAPEPNGNHGKLGFTIDANAIIIEVFSGSPAQEAGLQMGDLITAVDGQPIDKGADLPELIRQAEAANEFTIEIIRGEATQLLTVWPPVEAASS
jgi:hypothetical protein